VAINFKPLLFSKEGAFFIVRVTRWVTLQKFQKKGQIGCKGDPEIARNNFKRRGISIVGAGPRPAQ